MKSSDWVLAFAIVLVLFLTLWGRSCARECEQKGGVYLYREYTCVRKDAVIP